jgi:isopenicillin N synthase-like dioxygenase
MSDFSSIPVLDVRAIFSDDQSAKRALAQDFARAYGDVGFAYVTGHGIPDRLIDQIFAASARFHALPRAEKMALALDHNHRGFIPINTSTDVTTTLAEVTRPNQSESFMVMREDAPGTPGYLSGPNQWPNLPGFRADVMAYHDAMAVLGHRLMEIAALALGAEPTEVLPAFDTPTTWLRLLHYPPTDPAETDLYGSAPHKDFGCLTLLAQDDVGGLQVQTPAGDWVDAPRLPGSFVVNVGDMLHRWSNGRLRSTPHRVINASGRERYSCPFFYDPHVSTVIAPLPATITADRPAQYGPIEFGAFLRSELEASYDQHKAG